MILTIPEHEYHADTQRISASMIKLAHSKTLYHVWDAYINPEREIVEPTAAMKFGSMCHKAILEPETFDDCYTVMPPGLDRRTKEGKQLYADIVASGKRVVSDKDFNDALRVAESVHRLPDWKRIMRNDPVFEGVLQTETRRVRFDILVRPCADYPEGLIVDLKTTADCSPRAFGRDVAKMGYHLQAAWYIEVCEQVLGFRPEFMILAAEKKRPFVAAPYMVSEEDIAIGRTAALEAEMAIRQAMLANIWPAYHTQLIPVEMPAYVYDDFEDGLEVEADDAGFAGSSDE